MYAEQMDHIQSVSAMTGALHSNN